MDMDCLLEDSIDQIEQLEGGLSKADQLEQLASAKNTDLIECLKIKTEVEPHIESLKNGAIDQLVSLENDHVKDACYAVQLEDLEEETDELEGLKSDGTNNRNHSSKRQKRQPVRNFSQRPRNPNKKPLEMAQNEGCNNIRSSEMSKIRRTNAYSNTGQPEIELEHIVNEENRHRDISVEDLILELDNKLVTKEIKQKLKQSIGSDKKSLENSEKFHLNKDKIISAFLESSYGSQRCSVCEEPSTVYCCECGYLCLNHDISNHMENAFHQRYTHLTKLPPGLAKVDEGFVSYPVLVPRQTPDRCNCGGEVFSSEILDEKVKIVDLISGCFLASKKGFMCSACKSPYPLQLKDLFQEKLYPLSGSVESSTLFTFRTFDYYKLVKNENPGIGESNFLRVITRHSELSVTPQSFSEGYQEYNCIIYHIDELIKKEENNECPAKLSHYTRVHSDGITKLRRFNASFQLKNINERSFYENGSYGGPFIIDDKFLNDEIEVYKNHKMVSKNSLYFCGTSKYAAGNNTEESESKFDEKGMQICSCSHYSYLSAANQPKGEIFCLNNILLTDLKLRGYEVKECSIDIACRYSRWNEDLHENDELMKQLQLNPNVKEDPLFTVGDFHSKSHIFPCKAKHGHLYNGIGRAAAGEQQEVLNFKLAKLALTTRFMRPIKRNDTVTEFMLYENKKRNGNIVTEMLKKEKSYRRDLTESKVQLTKIEYKLSMAINEESIQQLRDAANKSDLEELSRMERDVEMAVLAVNYKKVQLKTNYDPSIKKKIRGNLNSAVKDLHSAVNQYNRAHQIKITEEAVVDGIFPWTLRHLPGQSISDPANFIKGCELYLKIQRTSEELDIIGHDLYSVLWKRFLDLENIERELNTPNEFSNCVMSVKKERRGELIRQLEYEILQVKSSSYSTVLQSLPDIHLKKLALKNSDFKTQETEDYSEMCVDVFNNVEDL